MTRVRNDGLPKLSREMLKQDGSDGCVKQLQRAFACFGTAPGTPIAAKSMKSIRKFDRFEPFEAASSYPSETARCRENG